MRWPSTVSVTSLFLASLGSASLVTSPRSAIASTARDTQLRSSSTRNDSSDTGKGPERASSVSKWHCVLVVRQQSATTRWARVYSLAASRSSPAAWAEFVMYV